MKTKDLVKLGSQTAKRGFKNEKDIAEKFNSWKTDEDAQKWLGIMGYPLDEIEKVEHYPITFVVKSEKKSEELIEVLKKQAEKRYPVMQVVDSYMKSVEEIINLPKLKECYSVAITQGYSSSILNEIIKQSKIEFQYDDEDDEEEVNEQ